MTYDRALPCGISFLLVSCMALLPRYILTWPLWWRWVIKQQTINHSKCRISLPISFIFPFRKWMQFPFAGLFDLPCFLPFVDHFPVDLFVTYILDFYIDIFSWQLLDPIMVSMGRYSQPICHTYAMRYPCRTSPLPLIFSLRISTLQNAPPGHFLDTFPQSALAFFKEIIIRNYRAAISKW